MNAKRFNEESGIFNVTSRRCQISDFDANITGGDFALTRQTANGMLMIELSQSPFNDSYESYLVHQAKVKPPLNMDVQFCSSQREKYGYFGLDLVDTSAGTPTPATPIAIASISQTTTTLTIVLQSKTSLKRGEWFDISGIVDSRFNYANCATGTVSSDGLTITATTADDATLPSVTATPSAAGGYVTPQTNITEGINGVGYRFSGSSVTSAALLVGGSRSNFRVAGTVGGAQLTTIGSTIPLYNNGGNGQIEIKPTSAYEIDVDRMNVRYKDYTVDSFSAGCTTRQIYESTVPDNNISYQFRLRSTCPKSMSRPIAKIVSIVKTGTTTATVTTEEAHGLVTGNIVGIAGARDQTAFANTANLTVTVLTATTFTVVFGTAVTATTYGGMVHIINGSVAMAGISPQAIQSISINADGILSIIGNATWTGITVGEYMRIIGCRNALNGTDMGIDGSYELIDLATTTIKLKAIKDGVTGLDVVNGNGENVSATLNTLVSTNCGGCVVQRTTGRIHDIKLLQLNPDFVKLANEGETAADKASPVYLVNSANITESSLVAPATGALTTAASTNATSIKTSAGTLYGAILSNNGATDIYVKFYNKASAPTVGTDVPLFTVLVKAGTPPPPIEFGRAGLRFSTGIAIAVTSGIANTDATAITAGSLVALSYI